jgi:hypothetical protein
MAGRLKIGEMMLRANLVDQLQLNAALAHQRQWGGKLGSVMVELGFVDEDMLWKGLAAQTGMPRLELPALQMSQALIQRIPVDLCEKHMVFPVSYRDDQRTLTVATADPGSSAASDDLGFRTRWKIAMGLSPELEIQWAIRFYYRGDRSPCPPLRKRKNVAQDSADDGSGMKITDISGKTVMKKLSDIQPTQPPASPPVPPPPAVSMPPPSQAAPSFGAPGSVVGFGAPPSMLPQGSQALPPELAALKVELDRNNKFIKTMVEMCIARGVFTQEEYVERMRK